MARSKVLGFILLSALLLLPQVVLGATDNKGLGSAALLAGISGLIAGLSGGVRIGAIASLGLGVFGALGLVVAGDPVLAGLVMAGATLLVGLTAKIGMAANLIMYPISLGFMIAVPSVGDNGMLYPAWAIGVTMAIGSLYGAVLGAKLGQKLSLPEPPRVSTTRAEAYAVTLALMAGLATWLVVERDLRHGGAWMIMTVLIVYRPYLSDAIDLTFQRAAGTLLGCIVAAAFGVLPLPAWVDLLVGLVLLALALMVRAQPSRPYWQYTAVITPTVVLFEGASSSVLATDWQRIFYTLLGAAMAVVVEVLLSPFYKRSAKAAGVTKY